MNGTLLNPSPDVRRRIAKFTAVLGMIGAVGYMMIFIISFFTHTSFIFTSTGTGGIIMAQEAWSPRMIVDVWRAGKPVFLYLLLGLTEAIISFFCFVGFLRDRMPRKLLLTNVVLVIIQILSTVFFAAFHWKLEEMFNASDVKSWCTDGVLDIQLRLIITVSLLPLMTVLIATLFILRKSVSDPRTYRFMTIAILVQLPIVGWGAARTMLSDVFKYWQSRGLFMPNKLLLPFTICVVAYLVMFWLTLLLNDDAPVENHHE